MHKFKIGDKVKILRRDDTFGWDQRMQDYVGKIHVLEDAYPNPKDVAGWCIDDWVWSEAALELVETKTTIREFKVGDKVRCIDNSVTTISLDVVYEVSAVTTLAGIQGIYLQGLPDDDQWWYARRFELVEAVLEVKKYTVEEVLEAYWSAYGVRGLSSEYIATTKAELDKRSDADYAKWLELKNKFG